MTPPTSGPAEKSRRYRSRVLARAAARLDRGVSEDGSVAIGEISDRLHQLGPLYLLATVACLAVSPLSGIPFVTTACGLSIAALSAQLLSGRRTAWLPCLLRRHAVRIDRLHAGLGRADRVAGAVEAAFRRRWVWLTRGSVRVVLLCACIAFGLTMPFLEVVPFAGTTLASVVLVIALALIARDGLAALVAALAISALAVLIGTLAI
jgi:hypothetical protein